MLAVIGNSVEVVSAHESGGMMNDWRIVMLLNELLCVNRRRLVVLILDCWLFVDVLLLVRMVVDHLFDGHVIRVRIGVLEAGVHCMLVIFDRPDIVLVIKVVVKLGARYVLDLCVGVLMHFLFRVAVMSPIRVEFLSLVD